VVISRPVPTRELADLELIRAAKLGDRAAAGVYLGRHRAYLMAAARAIAGRRLDPEDLLSAALVQLLGQWERGSGPEENATAYVIRSMRNAAIDESRSPRSRVDTFGDIDESDPIHAAPDDPRVHRAELHEEFGLVRRALDRLTVDQRVVLRETVIHGRKPADVAPEARRSAAAVSSLAARARRGLRRAVLIEFLAAGGPECLANAEQLPDSVETSPGGHRVRERGLAHVRECRRCQANWARFGALGAALGILPALVLADWTIGAPPASAAPDDSGPEPGGRVPGDPASGAASFAEVATAGAAVPLASASTVSLAALVRLVRRAPLLAAGSAVVLLGAALGVTTLALGVHDPSRIEVGAPIVAEVPELPGAVLDGAVVRAGDRAILAIDLGIPSSGWRIEGASIELPEGVRLLSAPGGWSCDRAEATTTCEVAIASPGGGEFVFAGPADEPPSGPFAMELAVLTDDGLRLGARASGTFGALASSATDGYPTLSRSS